MTRTFSAEDIQHKIQVEGFWYCFDAYLSPKSIEDAEIRKAADQFLSMGRKLRDLVEKKADAKECQNCGLEDYKHPIDVDGPGAGQQFYCDGEYAEEAD